MCASLYQGDFSQLTVQRKLWLWFPLSISDPWWINVQWKSAHTQNNHHTGLWVGQMVPSAPSSYQRSDENGFKKRPLPGNVTSQWRKRGERLRRLWGSETWKEEEETGGERCENISLGLIRSDLSIQSVTPSTICFSSSAVWMRYFFSKSPTGSDAVEYVGVKNYTRCKNWIAIQILITSESQYEWMSDVYIRRKTAASNVILGYYPCLCTNWKCYMCDTTLQKSN